MKRLHSFIGTSLACLLTATVGAQTIDIGSFDGNRARPGSDLATGVGVLGYGDLRSALANPANFGPGGIIACSTSISAATDTITAAYLADKDVFFTSVFSGDLSPAEQAAIQAFVASGGVVLVDANSIPSEQTAANSLLAGLGTAASLGPALQCANSSVAGSISVADNQLTNGPFGDLRGGTFGGSPAATATLGGADVSLMTCASDIRAAFLPGALSPGSGLVMYGGDPHAFDLFTSGGQANPNNQPLYLNAFAAACGPFLKELISGPLAVETGQGVTTNYVFKMSYNNPGGPNVIIKDTAPAEFQVIDIAGTPIVNGSGAGVDDGATGTFTSAPANNKPNNKSATKIEWVPDTDGGMLTVQMETRGPKKNGKFAPTSCGPLFLNGGEAEVIDALTKQALFQAAPICVAAVDDLDGGGVVADGSGDEDADGFSDYAEACIFDSDPCSTDSDADADAIPDSVDNCPNDVNTNQADQDGDGIGDTCDPCPTVFGTVCLL